MATSSGEGKDVEVMSELPVAIAVPLMEDSFDEKIGAPSTSSNGKRKANGDHDVDPGDSGAGERQRGANGKASSSGAGARMESLEVEVKAKGSGSGGASGRKIKRYEDWPGNETFFCGGACVTGPYYWGILGTCLLILIPCCIYVGLVAFPLFDEFESDGDMPGGYVILVVSFALPCVSLISLFCSGCMDPGIIPRAPPPQENVDHLSRTRNVEVNGHMVVVRYNETCNFYQPPRAHHCSVLNDCIERFDHYCPWVGTTIGKRNYRFYLVFVFSSSLLCIYTFACSAYLVKMRADGEDTSVAEALRKEPGALFMMAYVFICFWFVGGLSCFHIYLLSKNQTTYENIRYSYDRNSTNPYNRGCLVNWAEVFCVKVPERNCDFSAVVVESSRAEDES